MSNVNQLHKGWILLGLTVLMAATRFHHFGSVNFLPDASLAVFFLAGYFIHGRPGSHDLKQSQKHSRLIITVSAVFSLLILEAGLIDYSAINYGAVSDWCITPAYLFLIPTYAVMLYAGKWSAGYNPFGKTGVVKITGVLLLATSLAYIISNGSFYFFSGRYAEMTVFTYIERISTYYLPYLIYTLLYSGIAIALVIIIEKSLQTGLDDSKRASS